MEGRLNKINVFLLFTVIFMPLAAMAGSFQVSPVRVQLTPLLTTGAITIINDSKTDEIILQLRVMDWQQQSGEDVYTPSAALIATPPIFTMKAGASQTVRVGLRQVIQGDVQQAFRLYITEIPPPPKPGFQGLQVSLNVGVPIFVAPKMAMGGPLVWQAKMSADGKLLLSATNPANAHVQIIDGNFVEVDNKSATPFTLNTRYILAHQTTTWSLPVSTPPIGKLQLTVRTDAGPINSTLILDPVAQAK